ncbi:MAG: GIDE domain-containing protein [Pseudomonadota bacterium]
MDPADVWFPLGLSLLGLFGGLIWGTIALRRARLIEDTPTSRIRSAPQGYVELEGIARLMPGASITAPLSHMTCVWWNFTVCQKQTDSKGRTSWQTLNSGRSDDLFLLDDGGASCIVDNDGASVTPSLKFTWYGHSATPDLGPRAGSGFMRSAFCKFRYEEQMIPASAPVYALGWFRTERNEAGPVEESEAVRELLAEWKRDKQKMKLFDANKDGEVNLKEWEAVRRVALQQVRKQVLDRALDPDYNVLRKPPDGRPFLLSGIGQKKTVRSLHWQSGLSYLVAVGSAAALVLIWRTAGL